MDDRYFLITRSSKEVVASSAVRLPFEPKGYALAMRTELRSALATLTPIGVLHGLYRSADASPCDAENVLFYNVGMSHFRRLSERAIVFERSFDSAQAAFGHQHLVQYRTQEVPAFLVWQRGETVSGWCAASPRRGRDKPAEWWRAARDSMQLVGPSPAPEERFGLHVRVGGSLSSALTSLMKPLLDGVIAAMHHDPHVDAVAVDRLAAVLGEPIDATAERLRRTPTALEARRLVWPFSVGVQWNPADDRCVAAIVERDDSLGDHFAGECFRITAVKGSPSLP